jgi:dihydrofolate synthase/folylpolyglutamate synthase
MLETKDGGGFLRHFQGLARKVHCVTIPDAAASLEAEALAATAREAGLPAEAAADFPAALARLRAETAQDGEDAPRILICGSLYLAGWVLRRLQAAEGA